MKQPKITVVGLGPGRFGLITLESWQVMQQAERLVLRTRIHPTVADIEKRGLTFSSYDGFYEEAPDFETLYHHIAEDLLHRAAEQGDLVYAVPGSPLVAERTVVLLRELAKESGVTVDILPGMSFVEVMYTRLGLDPIAGLTILDAEDVGTLKERPAQSLITPSSRRIRSSCSWISTPMSTRSPTSTTSHCRMNPSARSRSTSSTARKTSIT